MLRLDRRAILKAISGLSASVGIPPVKAVQELHVTEHDAIVLSFEEELPIADRERICEWWRANFEGVKLIILCAGTKLEVLRGVNHE